MPTPRRPVPPAAAGRRPAAPAPPANPTPAGGVPHATGRPSTPRPSVPRTAQRTTAPRSGATPRVAPPTSGGRPSGTRPGATRPGSRGSGGRGGAPRAERVQVRLPRLFTVRVMVFSMVVLLAFILVSPTLHSYLQQRQELEELNAQVAAATTRNDDLQADLSRWDDDAYVIAQARERLSFVMPGEMAFRVRDPESVPDAPATDAGPAATTTDSTRPWYSSVWDSVNVAGEVDANDSGQTTEPAPEPSGTPAG